MATGYTLRTHVQLAERSELERISGAFRNRAKLLKRVGLLGLSSAARRVQTSRETGSTGRLGASLTPGHAENVFQQSEDAVSVGTNVRYAAQRHFGGTIYPDQADALAIPLDPFLQRHGIGPLELDPTRKLLQFRPTKGAKPNVFGVLINPRDEEAKDLRGRKRKAGKVRKPDGVGFLPPGPLYALAYLVRQEAKRFLYWSNDDRASINNELVPEWIRGK